MSNVLVETRLQGGRMSFGQMTKELALEEIDDTCPNDPRVTEKNKAIIRARLLVPVFDLFDKNIAGSGTDPNGCDDINMNELRAYLDLPPGSVNTQLIKHAGINRMFAIAEELARGESVTLSPLDIQTIRLVNYVHLCPF